MMSVLQLSRGDVQVSASVSALIPTRRHLVWRELQTALSLRLPDLKRPAWLTTISTLTTVVLAVATGILLGSVLMAGLAACMLGYVFYQVTRPFAVEVRPECASVGQLVKQIVARNFGAISDQCVRANAEELWESLRTLIAEQLGVRRSDVTKESHFVRDLGAD
jgi:hypothetical protein